MEKEYIYIFVCAFKMAPSGRHFDTDVDVIHEVHYWLLWLNQTFTVGRIINSL